MSNHIKDENYKKEESAFDSTKQDSNKELVIKETEDKNPDKKPASNYVTTKLRNIVLGVAFGAALAGGYVGNLIDRIFQPIDRTVVECVYQEPQERHNNRENIGRILEDFAEDRISIEQATREILEVFERMMPTSEEIRERVRQILMDAKKKGTKDAWGYALKELLQLIQFLKDGSTPTPMPTASIR